MKIGCCATTADYLTVKEQGYDCIELSARDIASIPESEFQNFRTIYRETGFPCIGFNNFCGAELPLVGPRQDLAALKDYLSCLCERGKALGIRNIGIGAPAARNPPDDWPEERSDLQMLAFLEMACALTEDSGIRILLEAINDNACRYLNRTADAVRLLNMFSASNSGLVLDYYHARLMEEEPESLGYAMPLVRHIHVSGGERGTARFFFTTADDEEKLRRLRICAFEQHYNGDTVSIEADRAFLQKDGECCRKLLGRSWK